MIAVKFESDPKRVACSANRIDFASLMRRMQENPKLAEIRRQWCPVRRQADRKVVFGLGESLQSELISEIHRHDGQALGVLVGDAHDFA